MKVYDLKLTEHERNVLLTLKEYLDGLQEIADPVLGIYTGVLDCILERTN
jgi:hypothetical protein